MDATKKKLSSQFSKPLLAWFAEHGRGDLPWKNPLSAYRVWLSEIMLQQTQVQTVIPYYHAFLRQFPSLNSLAEATDDQVLALWSGLGYYSRARNLHKTAQILSQEFKGVFPSDPKLLEQLPGIGPSTAAAIVSQAFDLPYPILDANVKRVLSRFFLVAGAMESSKVVARLWDLARLCMPKKQCADYSQAIMDLGALCCTNKNPNCGLCPVNNHCLAYKQGLQNQYPQKKMKKEKPTQHRQFLVLYNEKAEVYLEKRPPKGIWGGLWCLPSIEAESCAIEYTTSHFGPQMNKPKILLQFKHSFTHYHLQITALEMQIHLDSTLMKERGLWYSAGQLKDLGLAKPTSRILEYSFSQS